MSDSKEEKLYRAGAQEVANRYGVHLNTIYNWCRSADPPPFRRIGGQYRFNLEELDEWAATRPDLIKDGQGDAAEAAKEAV